MTSGGMTGGEAMNSILDGMDIGALSQKYCIALKQSLFLSFLYLVVIIALALLVLVLAFDEV